MTAKLLSLYLLTAAGLGVVQSAPLVQRQNSTVAPLVKSLGEDLLGPLIKVGSEFAAGLTDRDEHSNLNERQVLDDLKVGGSTSSVLGSAAPLIKAIGPQLIASALGNLTLRDEHSNLYERQAVPQPNFAQIIANLGPLIKDVGTELGAKVKRDAHSDLHERQVVDDLKVGGSTSSVLGSAAPLIKAIGPQLIASALANLTLRDEHSNIYERQLAQQANIGQIIASLKPLIKDVGTELGAKVKRDEHSILEERQVVADLKVGGGLLGLAEPLIKAIAPQVISSALGNLTLRDEHSILQERQVVSDLKIGGGVLGLAEPLIKAIAPQVISNALGNLTLRDAYSNLDKRQLAEVLDLAEPVIKAIAPQVISNAIGNLSL